MQLGTHNLPRCYFIHRIVSIIWLFYRLAFVLRITLCLLCTSRPRWKSIEALFGWDSFFFPFPLRFSKETQMEFSLFGHYFGNKTWKYKTFWRHPFQSNTHWHICPNRHMPMAVAIGEAATRKHPVLVASTAKPTSLWHKTFYCDYFLGVFISASSLFSYILLDCRLMFILFSFYIYFIFDRKCSVYI